MMMPMCQLMHRDQNRCERSYVQYTIRGVTESRKWAQPCKYFADDEACIPFVPCLKEETWRPIKYKGNSTVARNSTVTSPAPSLAPSTIATISPSRCPSMRPTFSPTIIPTFAPTISPTFAPTIKPTSAPTIIPTFAPTNSPTTTAPTSMPTSAPTIIPTFAHTNSPTTTAPTSMPTEVPTTIMPTIKPTTEVPTHAPSSVCDGLRKGRCRRTEGCRYVSNKMGCRIRTGSCSVMDKKYSCKNSQGCVWSKESHVCDDFYAQGSM